MKKTSVFSVVFSFFRWHRAILPVMVVIVLCVGRLQAQMQLSIDSNHVETGNPIQFHAKFADTQGKPDSLDFSVWEGILPVQNVIERTEWEHEGAFYRQSFTALFFDADTIHFPPLVLKLHNGQTLSSPDSLMLLVYATPTSDDLNDMAPIKDIHREAHRWTDYWPWIAGVLGILALIAGLYWYARQKPKTRLQSRVFETPAHILALKKLEALAARQLVAGGKVKEHYSELTYLLREYLEKRFAIPVLESTTEETLAQLQRSDFPEQWKSPIKTLLEQADLAKFAKIVPEEAFYESSMRTTRDIIQHTAATQENNPQP